MYTVIKDVDLDVIFSEKHKDKTEILSTTQAFGSLILDSWVDADELAK